jgi:dTMP kinase
MIINQYLNHELVLGKAVVHHLFSANRWETRQQFVADLKSCTPMVVDRYVASGWAYTIAGWCFDLEWAKQFDKGLIKPDLTIWLDGDARLISTRPGYGRHHLENLPFQLRVQEAFGGLMEEGWVKIIVDGRTETEIYQEIWGYISELFRTFYH